MIWIALAFYLVIVVGVIAIWHSNERDDLP
jgi:hypothetical protein